MALSTLSFFSVVFQYFVNGIYGLIQGFFQDIFSAIGVNIAQILMDYAYQINQYGVWALPVMALLAGLSGAGIYAILAGARLYDDISMGL